MLSKTERVAKLMDEGKKCHAATKSVGRSRKGGRKLMDRVEEDTVVGYNN